MLVFTSVCQKHGLASTEYVIFIFQKIRFVEARLSEVALFGNVRFAEAKRSKTKRNIILSSVWGGGVQAFHFSQLTLRSKLELRL